MPRLLQALHEEYPRITVGSDILPTSEVLLAVRTRRANVGIARTPAPMDGVRLQPLRHDRVGVLVCADHPLADKAEVDLGTVAQFPVTLNPRPANPSLYDFMVDLFASHKLRPSWVERDQAFELSQHLITSGAATALVGHSTATSLPTNLRWIPLTEQVTYTMTLVLPADAHAPTATCFHQVALAYASAHDWLH